MAIRKVRSRTNRMIDMRKISLRSPRPGDRFRPNNFVNAFIGGWQFATIFTARSGFAFSTNTGAFPVGFVFDSPAVLTGSSSALATNIHDVNGKNQLFANPTGPWMHCPIRLAAKSATAIICAAPASSTSICRSPSVSGCPGLKNIPSNSAPKPTTSSTTPTLPTQAPTSIRLLSVKLPLKPAGIAYCSSPCATSSRGKNADLARRIRGSRFKLACYLTFS